MNRHKQGLALAEKAMFCCALWGVSTPMVKIGYRYLDASHIPSLILWLGMEFVLAGLFSIGFGSAAEKKILMPNRKSITAVLVLALLQTVLQYICIYVGLSNTTSVKGSILKSTDVFFVMLITSLLFKQEKLTWVKAVSCLLGFSGIVLINLNGLSLDFHFSGDGILLLGIIFYSFSEVFTKPFAKKESPLTLCAYQMTLGGFILLLIGLSFGGRMDVRHALPLILGLGLIYAVSYSLWTCLLKEYPVSRVTVFSFTLPIFGVAFSALLLKEKSGIPIVNLLLSLFLVSGGIFLWSRCKTE